MKSSALTLQQVALLNSHARFSPFHQVVKPALTSLLATRSVLFTCMKVQIGVRLTGRGGGSKHYSGKLKLDITFSACWSFLFDIQDYLELLLELAILSVQNMNATVSEKLSLEELDLLTFKAFQLWDSTFQ